MSSSIRKFTFNLIEVKMSSLFAKFCVFVLCFELNHVFSYNIDYEKCDAKGVNFYDQLGCTPNKRTEGDEACPVSYNCKDYVIPDGKCLFNGKEINNNDLVDGSYCNKQFRCIAEPNSKSSFTSSLIIDCFRGTPKAGCYEGANEHGQCCQTEICPQADEVVPTCKVGEKIYKENETFTPPGTCYNCICKEGFQLYKEPFCIRRPCDTELRSADKLEKKCAPIYADDKSFCCPFDFLCAENVNSIERISKGEESHDKCKFGEKEYNIGDELKINYAASRSVVLDRKCSCLVPPYLACKN